MGRVASDLQGRRFGKLTVIQRDTKSYIHARRNYREAMWVCQCDCGVVKSTRSSRLTSGQSRSCGCLKRDLAATYGPRMSQFKRKEGTAQRGVFAAYRGRAKRINKVFELTFEQFIEISQQPCRYCGRVKVNHEVTPSGEVFDYNGVDRVDSSKGYILENCSPCCGWCNVAKFDLSPEEFILNCKLVASQN